MGEGKQPSDKAFVTVNCDLAKSLSAEPGIDLLAWSADTIPDNGDARRDVGMRVTERIIDFVFGRLSPEDRTLWREFVGQEECWPERWPEPSRKRIVGVLDKTIIEQAQTLGWRICLSSIVIQRMAQWHHGHEHGPELLRQLGEAVVLASKVVRGGGGDRLPVSGPEMKPTKAQGVAELRQLFRQCKRAFNQERTKPGYQKVCDWVRATIEGSPKTFPFLLRNSTSLFRYFDGHKHVVARLAIGDIRPATFFNEWGAWGFNLSPVTFEQAVSRLPSQKR